MAARPPRLVVFFANGSSTPWANQHPRSDAISNSVSHCEPPDHEFGATVGTLRTAEHRLSSNAC